MKQLSRSFVILLTILLLGCLPNLVFSSSAVGTTTGNFLKMNIGTRATGMGEAFCALADDVSAMRWNPAGLAFVFSPELETMHTFWLGNINHEFLGYLQPMPFGTLGINVSYLHMGRMNRIVQGVTQGKFNVYDIYGGLAYGIPVSKSFCFGFNLMGLESTIDRSRASAFSSDVGIMLSTVNRTFSFGLVGQNLGTTLRGEKLPINIKAGLAWKIKFSQERVDLSIALDANKPMEGDFNFALGIEHVLLETFAVRVGYKYDLQKTGLSNLAGLRLGAGLRWMGLLMNYAWAPYDSLGTTHRVSLGYKFGKAGRLPTIKLVLQADPGVFSPNNDGTHDISDLVIAGENLEKVEKWKFQIKDKDGAIILRKSGEILPISIPWDGTDQEGKLVPDGLYTCQIETKEWGRLPARSEWTPTLIDNTPPTAEIIITTGTFSPNGDGIDDTVTLQLEAEDANEIMNWRLEIYNKQGKVAKTFKGEEPLPQSIVWDGKDDYYKATVPAGEYRVKLVVYDIAGNNGSSSFKKLKVDIPLPKLGEGIKVEEEERGLKITFSVKVLFGIGKSILRKDGYATVEQAIRVLQAYPLNKVSIEGHTDSVGSTANNQKLSEKRAKAVYDYLVEVGKIDASRLSVRGWGEDRPIASNRTVRGRDLNRRVEIIVLKREEE
ncbi:PorV/PorQ family protein [bacterium]|nr:PorV/PorQ family protein [bacterium]NIN92106.1 PorV/PorQ family protein [bacterium]NIO18312.1 PorV/PorQ family protein [bacterium]NIO73277.1 PorV/PorQ family protein [bacterium]